MKNRIFALYLALLLAPPVFGSPSPGWELSATSPELYAFSVDRSVVHSGKGSGRVQSLSEVPRKAFGILTQKFDAGAYLHTRVRMSAYIRTENVSGWVGMWMRVDPHRGPALDFDNMQNRPIQGTTPWTRYSIELSVPAESESINYGVLLMGTGSVWFDDVAFEKMGVALPASKERQKIRGPLKLPLGPLNLGFED